MLKQLTLTTFLVFTCLGCPTIAYSQDSETAEKFSEKDVESEKNELRWTILGLLKAAGKHQYKYSDFKRMSFKKLKMLKKYLMLGNRVKFNEAMSLITIRSKGNYLNHGKKISEPVENAYSQGKLEVRKESIVAVTTDNPPSLKSIKKAVAALPKSPGKDESIVSNYEKVTSKIKSNSTNKILLEKSKLEKSGTSALLSEFRRSRIRRNDNERVAPLPFKKNRITSTVPNKVYQPVLAPPIPVDLSSSASANKVKPKINVPKAPPPAITASANGKPSIISTTITNNAVVTKFSDGSIGAVSLNPPTAVTKPPRVAPPLKAGGVSANPVIASPPSNDGNKGQ